MNRLPPPQMRMYSTVSAKASSGACKRRARVSAPASSTTISSTPNTANRQMPPPMALPASSGSPRPMRSPTRMVMPMDRPVITMVTVDMSMLPVATPETSAVAANCPTTSRSTPPYSA